MMMLMMVAVRRLMAKVVGAGRMMVRVHHLGVGVMMMVCWVVGMMRRMLRELVMRMVLKVVLLERVRMVLIVAGGHAITIGSISVKCSPSAKVLPTVATAESTGCTCHADIVRPVHPVAICWSVARHAVGNG